MPGEISIDQNKYYQFHRSFVLGISTKKLKKYSFLFIQSFKLDRMPQRSLPLFNNHTGKLAPRAL